MNYEDKKRVKALILRSVRDFNKFREENPNVELELSNMKFNDLDLRGINFSNMGLGMCKFIGANLEGADFTNAKLSCTKFFEAKLKGAKFDGASVGQTDFTKADLRNASLTHLVDYADVRFHNADLRGANLKGNVLSGQMTDGARFIQEKFQSTLEGSEKVKSRVQFLLPIFGFVLLIVAMLFGGWYLYLLANEKELGKAGAVMEAKPIYLRGLGAMKRNDFVSAEGFFKQALSINPKDLKSLIGLGDAIYQQGRPKEAIAIYKKGLEDAKDPDLKKEFEKRLEQVE